MKISILTPTYNREEYLDKLYISLIINSTNCKSQLEWLVMDDGSTDNTERLMMGYEKEGVIDIKYYKQENQGKMIAINNLVKKATGDYIIECDSDDYLSSDAIRNIETAIEEAESLEGIYALAFLKYDQNGDNMGNEFPYDYYKSTMFDLYFKEGITGEKALLYISKLRKYYEYEVVPGEKFITEASLQHRMDLKYNVLCVNKKVMTCEYKEDGYSKNILKIFYQNPKGYYKYFKEIFKQDLSGIMPEKKWYIYKQFVMFAVLSKKIGWIKDVKGLLNKLIVMLLYIPGFILTKFKFRSIAKELEQEKRDERRRRQIELEKKEENKTDIDELLNTEDKDFYKINKDDELETEKIKDNVKEYEIKKEVSEEDIEIDISINKKYKERKLEKENLEDTKEMPAISKKELEEFIEDSEKPKRYKDEEDIKEKEVAELDYRNLIDTEGLKEEIERDRKRKNIINILKKKK